MSEITIKLLGPLRFYKNGVELKIGRKRTLGLLAYLVTNPEYHSRNSLASLFWPDYELPIAKKYLRNALYELRSSMGCELISADVRKVKLDSSKVNYCDYSNLFDLHSWLSVEPSQNIKLYKQAIEEASGDFLEGFELTACDDFESWLRSQREVCEQIKCKVYRFLVERFREKHQYDDALSMLKLWHTLDEYNDDICQKRMAICTQFGDHQQAFKIYEGFKSKLKYELNITPSTETCSMIGKLEHNKLNSLNHALLPATELIPSVKYIENKGIHIAYQLFGQGKDVVIIVNSFMSHLDSVWENKILSEFYRSLSKNMRVVLFDRRGSGLSDRLLDSACLQDSVEDVYNLMNKLGLKSASLLGISDGGGAAILFAHNYPERVHSIILYGSAAKWSQDKGYMHGPSDAQYDCLYDFLLQHWGQATSIEVFSPSVAGKQEIVDWCIKC